MIKEENNLTKSGQQDATGARPEVVKNQQEPVENQPEVAGKPPLEIEECLHRLLQEIKPMKRIESVPLMESLGRVLGEDIIAAEMVPPFPKSAMDGYAVRAEDIQGASKEQPVTLTVAGELLAGDYSELPYREKTAVRVMTGSYVPEGYDAVVRQEDTDYGEEIVTLYKSVPSGGNYCQMGEDIRKGDVVLQKGTRITSLHIGILASLGEAQIPVYKAAETAVISTGTELTAVGDRLLPGKIYSSISYLLAAEIGREGLRVWGPELCADEEVLLEDRLRLAAEQADLIITTGAVSVGKKDIVPTVLEHLGARILFRRANIQPGTPTLAAVFQGKVILALSGNPYAALANFEIYFWPAMAKLMHSDSFRTVTTEAVLDSDYHKVNHLRRFIRAYAEDGKVCIPSNTHASSVLYNLVQCNCFIDLESGRAVQRGDTVKIHYFK